MPTIELVNRSVFEILLAGCALAAVATSCQSSLTGNEGNLTFYYPTDDEIDFNKPVAVGAKLELTVKTAGIPHASVTLTEVKPANPAVLAVKGTNSNVFTLEGIGDGNTAITVKATKADGSSTTDTINMMARKAEVIEVTHSCTSGPIGHYLVGKQIFLPYDLKLNDGRAVIGFGYHPLKVAPETGLQLDQVNKAQWAYVYKTAALAGDVTLTSTLPAGKAWTLRLVDEGQIDGGKLEAGSGKTLGVVAGTSAIVLARPTVGGQPVCQPDTTFTVTTKTADICTVTASAVKLQGSKELVEAWSWISVAGKKLGVCEFEVVWPKANKGQGATVPLKVDIVQLVKP
ncbi:MAG: hypothetical protein EXR77_10590 [Myxococcales bacterium]|nr:hypothetical protein [Myxococcales bacterium]